MLINNNFFYYFFYIQNDHYYYFIYNNNGHLGYKNKLLLINTRENSYSVSTDLDFSLSSIRKYADFVTF